MSWSMIDFGDFWAHAHDNEQILFMSFASEFLDSSSKFQALPWLRQWQLYWLDHKSTLGNGCSDIDLPRFLDVQEKVLAFRQFLQEYKTWVSGFGAEIPTDIANEKTGVPGFVTFTGPCEVQHLVSFVSTIEAVLDGDLGNKRVHRKTTGGT
jgi:hypothetical protein